MKSTNQDKAARRGIWIAAIVVIAWMMISSVGGPLLGSLSTVAKNDTSKFLPASSETEKFNAAVLPFTKGQNAAIPELVLFLGNASDATVGKVNAFLQTLPTKPLVDDNGQAIAKVNETIGEFLSPGAQLGAFPSANKQAILGSIPVDSGQIVKNLPNKKPVLPALTSSIRYYTQQFAISTGLVRHVTGPAAIFADLIGAFGGLDTTLLLATVLVVWLILVIVYRSFALPILPLLAAVVALSTAGGIVYTLAKHNIIALDGASQGILSVLVLGAATDYALLLIARYREELHHDPSRVHAMRVTIRGVVEPIVASGSTVAIGLLVLLLASLQNNKGLGPVGAIGIVSAVVTILTFLPALLLIPGVVLGVITTGVPAMVGIILAAKGHTSALVAVIPFLIGTFFAIRRISGAKRFNWFNRDRFPTGRWIFWPKVPLDGTEDEKLSGIWSRVAVATERKPKRYLVATTLLLVVFAGFIGTLKATGVSTSDSFTKKPDSVKAQTLVSQYFALGEGQPTEVFIGASHTDAATTALKSVNGIVSVTSSPEINGYVVLSATLNLAADSNAAVALIPQIRTAMHAIDSTSLVGGQTAVYYDTHQAAKRDQSVIIPIVLLIIAIILGLLLRSIVAAFSLLVTVILSYIATLGACSIVFHHIFHFKGEDSGYPLFAFIFLVALGIDYNIFLMTRVREESIKLGTRAGVTKGVTVTGGVITSAGIVLASTFAVLSIIPILFLAEIGFTVAFGVLLDTLIVRSILVPALVHIVGPKIWWPSKLAKAEFK